MSCFIMDKKSLAAIANATAILLNSGREYFGFNAPKELIDACADCTDNPNAPRKFYVAETICSKLYSLNVTAFNDRYPSLSVQKDDDDSKINVDSYKINNPLDIEDDGRFSIRPWHYQLAKMLDCWIYQTDEDATHADAFRMGMVEFRNRLCRFIVCNSEIYGTFKWGAL